MIHYFLAEDGPLYALLIYGKGERADLTVEQKRQVTAFATRAKVLARSRRTEP